MTMQWTYVLMILGCHSLADALPAADPLDSCNVVWGSPSENAHGSMPLGNGDVGINAWVEANGDLVFYVSKTDAWDENARLCKIGRWIKPMNTVMAASIIPWRKHTNWPCCQMWL